MAGLSLRAKEMLDRRDFLDKYCIKCVQDPYSSDRNPKGYVNLGTSYSTLCEDIVLEKLNEPGLFHYCAPDQHYSVMFGIKECREAIASCLTRHLSPNKPLNPDNVLIVNGGVAVMEILACCLMNPGEILLTPSPCYTRIFFNFSERFKGNVKDVYLKEDKDQQTGNTFELTADLLEAAIIDNLSQGMKVRGFLLVNPNNPLGDVYSPQLVLKLMEVCRKYDMHFICDEAYAMSIYETDVDFKSVLSLEVPDRDKTHVLWSFSKDISLAGFRIGALITWNEDLLEVVKRSSMYTAVPVIVQRAAARLLNDKSWLDKVLLPAHRSRLRDAANMTRNFLNSIGVTVRPAAAGFFLWVDFSKYMQGKSKEEEIDLFEKFMKNKVYLIPGSELHCLNPGWFRLVFSAKPSLLEEGLERIKMALHESQKHPREISM